MFGPYCHEFMHPIGRAAYQKISTNGIFDVPVNTAICSSGFYHGLVEAMLAHGFDKNESKKLCDSVARQLHNQGVSAVGSCYHGLGHGFAENYIVQSDPDIPQLLTKSISLCHDIVSDPFLTENCYAGVFNVISTYFIEHPGTHWFVVNEPFGLCLLRKESYKACYAYMVLVLLQRNGGDFIKTATILDSLSDKEQDPVVQALSYKRAVERVGSGDIENDSRWCDIFPGKFWSMCIAGYIQGLVGYGKPGGEHIQVIRFCTSKPFSDEEKKACLGEGIHVLSMVHPVSYMQSVCESLGRKFLPLCHDMNIL
ncbi:hypothetical protein HY086_03915 [Candidatus Gottesmanbacteria bacterium]|nr:hypothetical protein [Candidatus Gottesmanbacteria bacterium]